MRAREANRAASGFRTTGCPASTISRRHTSCCWQPRSHPKSNNSATTGTPGPDLGRSSVTGRRRGEIGVEKQQKMEAQMQSIGMAVTAIKLSVSPLSGSANSALTPKRAPAKPAADELCDVRLPGLVCWKPDKGPCEIVRPLSDQERGRLQGRAIDLETALIPYGDEERRRLKGTVGVMFGGFRNMRQQGEDAESTVDVILAVLREFPAWAIEQACLSISRHEIRHLNPNFPPNDGQIHDIVAAIVAPYRGKLRAAVEVLNATIREPKRFYCPPSPQSGRMANMDPRFGRAI